MNERLDPEEVRGIVSRIKAEAVPEAWRKHQVQTLRWRLYQTAGKVVSHAGALVLKVALWMFALFEEVRTRCRELACP